MDDEEKRAWLLEHCVFNPLDKDIDRMFARLNYFLVASAFLTAAYVTLVTQRCGSDVLTNISRILVVAGLVLSLLFYASGSWNTWITWRFHSWVNRMEDGPAWLWDESTGLNLGQRCSDLLEAHAVIYEWCTCCFGKAVCDWHFMTKAGLMARLVPAMFFLIWLGVAWTILPEGWPRWLLLGGLVVALVVGLVASRKCRMKTKKKRFIEEDGQMNPNWSLFAMACFRRSSPGRTSLDDYDRFVWIWMAFDSWMKRQSTEDEPERKLVKKARGDAEMQAIFETVTVRSDIVIQVTSLRAYDVLDMRPGHESSKPRTFNGTYGSFLEFAYQVRCNLFHGAKDVEASDKDRALVQLCYRILYAVFSEYLAKKGSR